MDIYAFPLGLSIVQKGEKICLSLIRILLHLKWAETIWNTFFFSVRREETQTLAGPNEYVEFKKRLTAIEQFYKKHPNEVSENVNVQVS